MERVCKEKFERTIKKQEFIGWIAGEVSSFFWHTLRNGVLGDCDSVLSHPEIWKDRGDKDEMFIMRIRSREDETVYPERAHRKIKITVEEA